MEYMILLQKLLVAFVFAIGDHGSSGLDYYTAMHYQYTLYG
jgi:hypothetical protein